MEVSEHANYREIRSAFRRLAKKYHPDLNNSAHAEEMIKKINVAFEVLSDKEKRREYDSMCFNDNNRLPKQKEEKYNENENAMPVDQHELIALVESREGGIHRFGCKYGMRASCHFQLVLNIFFGFL
jgi:DnaJ-class molecular chaperone